MQPKTEHITYPHEGSLLVHQDVREAIPFEWHVHPEAELTWVADSQGMRYVGNSTESFGPDDLVLLGSGLPHTWTGKPISTDGPICCTVVQFLPARLLGDEPIPELRDIAELLRDAGTGLAYGERTRKHTAPMRQRLITSRGSERVIALLELLQHLTASDDVRPLARGHQQHSITDRRMEKVLKYLNDHFTEPVTLDDLARVAAMSRSAFSRYFRRTTGTGLIDYMTGLRLSKACAMLRDTDEPVSYICYDSGFGNLSNFNRRFLSHYGHTPSAYRLQWRDRITDRPVLSVELKSKRLK